MQNLDGVPINEVPESDNNEGMNLDPTGNNVQESQPGADSGLGNDMFAELFGAPVQEPQDEEDQNQPPAETPPAGGEQDTDWRVKAAEEQAKREAYEAMLQSLQQQGMSPQQAEQTAQEAQKEPEFPPPPPEPKQPAGFSYEEAMSDPKSESAQYLRAKDEWTRNLAQYNALAVQYMNAKMRETQEQIMQQQQQQMMLQQQQAQIQALKSDAIKRGLTPEEAEEFVQVMSKDDVVTLDNLIQLFKIMKGKTTAQPSSAFQQTQAAQAAVPNLSTMAGRATNAPQDPGKELLGAIIGNMNKNVFGKK